MSHRAIPPNDPRLTAYVLGELDEDDRAEINQQIEFCPETQAEIDEIRETIELVTLELAAEPVPELTDEQRSTITAESEKVATVESPTLSTPRSLRSLVITIAVVAATLLIVVLPLLHQAEMTETAVDDALVTIDEDFGYFKIDTSVVDQVGNLSDMNKRLVSPVVTTHAGSSPAPGSPKLDPDTLALPPEIKYGRDVDVLQLYVTPRVILGSDLSPTKTGESLGIKGRALKTSGNISSPRGINGAVYRTKWNQAQSIRKKDNYSYKDKSVSEKNFAAIQQRLEIGRSRLFLAEKKEKERLLQYGRGQSNTETYLPIVENEFLSPVTQPLSTFGIDVDTAAYANVRRFINHNQWPDPHAVRIEELINYFDYDYPQPDDSHPFSVSIEVGRCPWKPIHRLVRIGLKGKEIPRDQRPPSNLVFLVDVSGSMRDSNKLPLVKAALEILVEQMTEDDRIAIVTYASSAGLLLESTSGEDKKQILAAIKNLNANGSTNGEAGLKLAYETAAKHIIDKGTNRIVLCTDGDFNVGVTSDDELVKMIQQRAKSNIFLSIFGFGMGNLKDAKLEQLADKGNGHYGYVDSLREARKLFAEEMVGMLYTIAKDVKLQVEFNPTHAGAYRLIGYENRALSASDFNDDTKDAGDIGAGHTVTALYEVIPVDKMPESGIDPLKYQRLPGQPLTRPAPRDGKKINKELLTVKLRYKKPNGKKSSKLEIPVVDNGALNRYQTHDFDWAAAVAAFGMTLRDSKYRSDADFELVLELALSSLDDDESGYRHEFIEMVHACRVMQARRQDKPIPTAPELSQQTARKKSTCAGKYTKLLKKIEVPADVRRHGTFKEYGYWSGRMYAGYTDLPPGYWIYVAPHWFIWGERNDSP